MVFMLGKKKRKMLFCGLHTISHCWVVLLVAHWAEPVTCFPRGCAQSPGLIPKALAGKETPLAAELWMRSIHIHLLAEMMAPADLLLSPFSWVALPTLAQLHCEHHRVSPLLRSRSSKLHQEAVEESSHPHSVWLILAGGFQLSFSRQVPPPKISPVVRLFPP